MGPGPQRRDFVRLWTPLGPFYTPFPDHFQTISGPWTLPWWFLGHPWDPRRLGDVSGVPPGIFREASELHFGIIFYFFFPSKNQWNLMLFLGFLQSSFWTSFCLPFSLENGIHFLCDFSQHRLCFLGVFPEASIDHRGDQKKGPKMQCKNGVYSVRFEGRPGPQN